MANEKWSAFNSGTAVTFSDGTLVGIQGGINVQFLASSFLLAANNLSDLGNVDTAQTNLGLGTAAPLAASNNSYDYLASVDGSTVIGNLPKFSDTLGTIVDSAITFSNATAAYYAVTCAGSVTVGHIPKFGDVNGTLVNALAFSNSALTYAVTCNGSVSIGNMALFADVNGSLEQNVAALNNVANSSATPGTVRAIIGEMTSTATTQTSGNLVGVRGAVNFVGSSTNAFMYGVQGKLIATGTLASGQFQAGVFGQADFSAATLDGCQFAAVWGDYGASIGTVSDSSSCYGLAMTNTTAAVLSGQLYLYGGATNLMLLNDNNGLVGASYFQAAGTGSGSCGHASYVAATKALQVNINGTNYWLPLFASNS